SRPLCIGPRHSKRSSWISRAIGRATRDVLTSDSREAMLLALGGSIMKTAVIPMTRLPWPAAAHSRARLPDFIMLMKPRVMVLALFTAIVGLAIAPGHVAPLRAAIAILAIAIGAGAAGALNMWYDADIDAVMRRTAERPIPRGNVARGEALAFGLVLAGGAVA